MDARLAMSGSSRSKRVTCDTYRVANQLRMTARRVLEWIGMFRKAWLVFMYDMTCYYSWSYVCVCSDHLPSR